MEKKCHHGIQIILLSKLIDDLSLIATAESGQLKLNLEPINLSLLLKETSDIFIDSAKNGEWVSAPGNLLLYQLFNEFTDMKIIAEDLGDVSPKVTDLREKFNLPGMRVLQFEFGETIQSPELYPYNSVAYTGTHDNDTTLGWFSSLSISNQKKVRENLLSSETPIHFQFIDHLQSFM